MFEVKEGWEADVFKGTTYSTLQNNFTACGLCLHRHWFSNDHQQTFNCHLSSESSDYLVAYGSCNPVAPNSMKSRISKNNGHPFVKVVSTNPINPLVQQKFQKFNQSKTRATKNCAVLKNLRYSVHSHIISRKKKSFRNNLSRPKKNPRKKRNGSQRKIQHELIQSYF